MLTVCYAAKGGQGCTTVATTLAMLSAPATLIDLTGDVPAVLGLPEPEGPGVTDLLASGDPLTLQALDRWAIVAAPGLRLVPRGNGLVDEASDRWEDLAGRLAVEALPFYVDAGIGSPITAHAPRRLLVTRHCYLALRRANRSGICPSGIITIREPGRALDTTDIEKVVGAPVVATLEADPRVARAIDAGILASRLPSGLERPLRRTLRPTPAAG